jgi:hypothetical protein
MDEFSISDYILYTLYMRFISYVLVSFNMCILDIVTVWRTVGAKEGLGH